MKITTKGQVTIPQRFRRSLGAAPRNGGPLRGGRRLRRHPTSAEQTRTHRGKDSTGAGDCGPGALHGRRDAPHAGLVNCFLADTNVLLDIVTEDPAWGSWSERAVQDALVVGSVAINPIIYAELSPAFGDPTSLDARLAELTFGAPSASVRSSVPRRARLSPVSALWRAATFSAARFLHRGPRSSSGTHGTDS